MGNKAYFFPKWSGLSLHFKLINIQKNSISLFFFSYDNKKKKTEYFLINSNLIIERVRFDYVYTIRGVCFGQRNGTRVAMMIRWMFPDKQGVSRLILAVDRPRSGRRRSFKLLIKRLVDPLPIHRRDLSLGATGPSLSSVHLLFYLSSSSSSASYLTIIIIATVIADSQREMTEMTQGSPEIQGFLFSFSGYNLFISERNGTKRLS